ncbi:MAG: hypothetical protein WCK89_13930 [bacterium]
MLKQTLLILGSALCLHAWQTRAADLKDFPSQTHWVLNVDLMAARASPMVNFIVDKMDAVRRQEAQKKLDAIKAMFGVDLVKDIDQLVIAGNGDAEKGGVAYVYGAFDTQRLTTILAGGKDFASIDYSGFKVLSWLDEKDSKPKYLSFAKPGLAMLSSSSSALTDALDVLTGNKAGLAPDAPISDAFAPTSQAVLSLHAFDISAIVGQAPKAKMLQQAQALSLLVQTVDADTLEAALSVTTATAETALQIQQAIMGIQALMLLQTGSKPEIATLASLAQITSNGSTVNITLKLPKAMIEKAMNDCQARQAAATAAPVPAATN